MCKEAARRTDPVKMQWWRRWEYRPRIQGSDSTWPESRFVAAGV